MPSTFRGAVNAGGRQANKFTGNALKLTQIKMTTKQSLAEANRNVYTNTDKSKEMRHTKANVRYE